MTGELKALFDAAGHADKFANTDQVVPLSIALAALQALREEVEGLRRDAGRYRFIRDNYVDVTLLAEVGRGWIDVRGQGDSGDQQDAARLDTAIDTALYAQEPAPQGDKRDAPSDGPWCLYCNKAGHLTTECWSTHAINTAPQKELARLCDAARSGAKP